MNLSHRSLSSLRGLKAIERRPQMRNYEAVYYLLPGLDEAAVQTFNEKFSSQLPQWGGELVKLTSHGKKRLAYQIKEKDEGYFVILEFKGDQAAKELARVFRITDEVLRSVIVRQN